MKAQPRLALHKRKYYCPQCFKVEVRISDRRFIKSFCEATGKTNRLQILNPK